MPKINTSNSEIVTLEKQVRIAYNAPIENIIKSRSSCRSYTDEKLTAGQIFHLNEAFKSANRGLLGEKASFRLVRLNGHEGEKVKIGTYGMIVNPHTAIVGEIENSEMAFESYGFLLEHIVLKAQELGLNTCWLGYYSNKGSENFHEILKKLGGMVWRSLSSTKTEEGLITPAICIIGYESEKKGRWDKFSKNIAQPHLRKQFGEMFFDSEYGNSLLPATAGKYAKPLEMIIPAPSAGNKQPWRVVMDEKGDKVTAFHFYMEPSKRWDYNTLNLHKIDMGIAMCHFDLMARELGYKGVWQIDEPNISLLRNVYYTATWLHREIR
jgi:nitroreductase